MPISDNEFFREVTLRICGSLDIEQALYQSFLFIQHHMPADRMTLGYFDPQEGAIIIYASATLDGGTRTNVAIPISEDQQMSLQSPEFPDILLLNSVAPRSIAALVMERLGHPVASIVSLRMRLQGELQGNLTVIANGRDRFTRPHVERLAQINDPFAIALSNSRRYQELTRLKDLLVDDNRYLQEELRQMAGDQIIGDSPQMQRVLFLVRQVAPRNSPVLVLGETGTGKELVARAVHDASPRREGPFIKVNCGAVPPSLMDSELFGHEKGAFTGATAMHRGRFERAHNGTIFLDEVGELSPEAQVRLLRVLQEKEIERVGGTRSIALNIRVVAATNRPLKEMVASGRFREDLYYRLNVFPIEIPPLRERIADIEQLTRYFLQRQAKEMRLPHIPSMAPIALEKLRLYAWPGNVRELAHVVERSLILNRGESLTFDELSVPGSPATRHPGRTSDDEPLLLDTVMDNHIRKVLAASGGRVEGREGAARKLGMKPGTLRYRMKKLGIPFGRKTHSHPIGRIAQIKTENLSNT
ncbi:sigma 54-interacting transcriptional regulator [Desulfatitalea alkaliphila]|uniref:Sigma 54-interacting transcriptional regulator n=1 Tax=Desulfatitalea alkaliphila TaxID=2929485 RepID=A0AA41UIR2_9BACT|nr:sigma 54-interacting transcriptional regulator [Desulfatitalea alkaliphila]MCJ8501045.1 sigma 54-interacting transcriptional regulator [Desulfatitalea alkaliphila]